MGVHNSDTGIPACFSGISPVLPCCALIHKRRTFFAGIIFKDLFLQNESRMPQKHAYSFGPGHDSGSAHCIPAGMACRPYESVRERLFPYTFCYDIHGAAICGRHGMDASFKSEGRNLKCFSAEDIFTFGNAL